MVQCQSHPNPSTFQRNQLNIGGVDQTVLSQQGISNSIAYYEAFFCEAGTDIIWLYTSSGTASWQRCFLSWPPSWKNEHLHASSDEQIA